MTKEIIELLSALAKHDDGATLKIQESGGFAVFTPRSVAKSGTTLILVADKFELVAELTKICLKREAEKSND